MGAQIDFGRASALPLPIVLSAIPSFPRAVIERLVQHMVDHLDQTDGDPDLEPEHDCCIAGDDGCGAVFSYGRLFWGSDDDGGSAPSYAIDQTEPLAHPDIVPEFACAAINL